MTLPDAGHPEDYTEAEMMQLVGLFETSKETLTKNQKAAVARYNFKKNKGDAIVWRGEGASGDAAPAPAPGAAGASKGSGGTQPVGDIVSQLPPDIQVLAGKDPATLTKEEKIKLAKAKSQAVRAQQAAKDAGGAPEKKGPSPEEIAAKKALEFAPAKKLNERFGQDGGIEAWAMQHHIPYATVKAERVVDVVRYLHMEMGFTYLRNQTATDYPPDRLEVVYNLLNLQTKEEVALKVKLPRSDPNAVVDKRWHSVGLAEDMPSVPSVYWIHRGSDWLEREVFDLLGIQFTGHPYLVRLMMPDGWVGHPLRKDYDLTKEQFIGMNADGTDIVSFREEDGW